MLQPHPNLRPRRLQGKLLRPFQNHHRRRSKNVLQPQSLKIMKTLNPVKIPVINLRRPTINVNERKSRASNLVFGRRAKSSDNPLSQRGLPASKLAGQQHQNGRLQSFREFPTPSDRLFRRSRNHLFTHAAAAPAKVSAAPPAPREPPLPPQSR